MYLATTLIGFFGLMKYILDRAVVYSFEQMRISMMETLKNKGKLSSEEQQRILAETTSKMWDHALLGKEAHSVTVWTRLGLAAGSFYQYMVPGPIRTLLFVPTYVITYPLRIFVERKKMDLLRERTREMAISGLWSFLIPLTLGVLAASALVQTVDYVRIVNGRGPEGSEINQHIIKRIVIGPGRFSLSLPYHPVIYAVSYAIVLFAVFHTLSFFFFLHSTLTMGSSNKQLPS